MAHCRQNAWHVAIARKKLANRKMSLQSEGGVRIHIGSTWKLRTGRRHRRDSVGRFEALHRVAETELTLRRGPNQRRTTAGVDKLTKAVTELEVTVKT
jgi:hypothetical protein